MANLYCGFPKTFSANPDESSEINLDWLINRLLKNSTTKVSCEPGGEFSVSHTTSLNGENIKLPFKVLGGGPTEEFVGYIQALLDINGYDDLIVFYDYHGITSFPSEQFSMHILTQTEFEKILEYPIEEYRYDGAGIIHPNVCYTVAYVSQRVGRLFKFGHVREFPEESVAYQGAFGTLCDTIPH